VLLIIELSQATAREYNPSAMLPKAGYSTPMLHVADVARSIRFYELLGLELIDIEGPATCPGWARMHCEGGALMFLLAEEPVDASAQAILLAMYTPDLPALREHLLASGVKVPPITYPGYMPSGQITFADPDGYIVGINHWGDAEHAAWLKAIEQKKKSGALPPSQ
jgi:catechol 2,3-dioxygenase-like lactoylglutathione lyase family enzyme